MHVDKEMVLLSNMHGEVGVKYVVTGIINQTQRSVLCLSFSAHK